MNASNIYLSSLEALAGSPLMELTAKGSLVLILAGLVYATARRHLSAADRHSIWAGALLALLALPVLQWVLPAWSIPLVPIAEATAAPTVADPVIGGGEVLAASPTSATETAATSWSFGLIHLWALGAFAVLLHLTVGLLRIRGLLARSRPITDPDWLALGERLRRELGVKRPIELLRIDEEMPPITCGAARPKVLLPASAEEWSVERRRVVLLHELAHVVRFDSSTQILGRVACAVHWFNPLVWIAARFQRLESEHACDDRVLEVGVRPSDYAHHLLAIARTICRKRMGAVVTAMARTSKIEGRLVAVLAEGRNRRPLRRALPVLLLMACGFVSLAAAQPAQDRGPSPTDLARAENRDSGSESSTATGAGYSYFWTAEDGSRYRLETRGPVELKPSGTAIQEIGAGGHLVVEQTDESSVRRVEAFRGATGIEYEWTVDELPRPFERGGDDWLTQALASFNRPRSGEREESRAVDFYWDVRCQMISSEGSDGESSAEAEELRQRCRERTTSPERTMEERLHKELERTRSGRPPSE